MITTNQNKNGNEITDTVRTLKGDQSKMNSNRKSRLSRALVYGATILTCGISASCRDDQPVTKTQTEVSDKPRVVYLSMYEMNNTSRGIQDRTSYDFNNDGVLDDTEIRQLEDFARGKVFSSTTQPANRIE